MPAPWPLDRRHHQVLDVGYRRQKDKWHRFALAASFLLGNDGHSDFASHTQQDSDAAADNAMWHIALGRPLGTYAKVGGAYLRDFVSGKVVVVRPRRASPSPWVAPSTLADISSSPWPPTRARF
jgi:hypothetical protein